MEFEMVERQSLVVWLYTLKHVKNLRKHGYIHYVSQKLKYVVMYIDKSQTAAIIKQLEKYHFIRNIDLSKRDDIDMTFKDAIPNRIDPNKQQETTNEESDFLQSLAKSLELPKKNKKLEK